MEEVPCRFDAIRQADILKDYPGLNSFYTRFASEAPTQSILKDGGGSVATLKPIFAKRFTRFSINLKLDDTSLLGMSRDCRSQVDAQLIHFFILFCQPQSQIYSMYFACSLFQPRVTKERCPMPLGSISNSEHLYNSFSGGSPDS